MESPEHTPPQPVALPDPILSRRKLLLNAVQVLVAVRSIPGRAEPGSSRSLKIVNYWSPRNKRRPLRPSTRYIVLHTTEGAEQGSLNKVRRLGETHYFVGLDGTVYRVIDRARIATHAGRSMWHGRRALDDSSIGIEVSGYYDQDITQAQYSALKELLRQLKIIYKVPDVNILTHSMVAYGRPNRYHPEEHRGRKRCGMIFARPQVRARLGITSQPAADEDVRAGRVAIADPVLFRALYPRAAAPAALTASASPPPEIQSGANGGEESFEGFLEIGKDGASPRDLAGSAYKDERTIYFFADGLVRTGAELSRSRRLRSRMENPPNGTRVLVGYIYGGHVRSSRPPSRIAGARWNYPSTYYRFPDGKIISGDEIEDSAIPEQTLIFYQR
jgi:N-acetylmuramoyl-L-alanine amidase